MPTRVLSPCSKAGCLTLVKGSGYCREHAYLRDAYRALYEASRLGANRRGYNGRWKKYAARFLVAHPLCADPYHRHVGVVTPSFQVDHVTPHKGDRKLFWDPTNHQALCASCGGYKSAIEAGGRAESPTQQRFDQLTTGALDTHGLIVHAGGKAQRRVLHTRKSLQHTELQPTGRGVEISGPTGLDTVIPAESIASQVCSSTGKTACEVRYAGR
jgi:5-methylcytosine-specific restriction enzyme A